MGPHRYPPGPSALTAIRGLRALGGGDDLSTIAAFLTDTARRYGPIARWKILGRQYFLLDDAPLIEELLVGKASDYRKGRGIERLRRLLGDGLLSSEEPQHLRRRRMLQPAFHRERIARYARTMVTATQAHIANWSGGTVIAVDAEMSRLTLTIAAQTLFGTTMAAQADTVRAALMTVMRTFPASISRLSELLDALPLLPITRRFLHARAELDAVIYEVITARRHDPAAEHDDLLAMLLAARDADGGLDDAGVRDEAMTLFIAGHETTANALAWAWYLLARNPAAAERVRAEIDAVIGDRTPGPADVPVLTYTRAVLAETMRLYPPAWALGRRALRDTALGSQVVPAGSVVIASQLVTHRNPRYWNEPAAFRPERWLAGEPAPRCAYFPFGGGSRLCIGESFAWMEGVIVIATIARRFTLDAVDDVPVDVEPLVTLRPRGAVRVRIGLRRSAPSAMIP